MSVLNITELTDQIDWEIRKGELEKTRKGQREFMYEELSRVLTQFKGRRICNQLQYELEMSLKRLIDSWIYQTSWCMTADYKVFPQAIGDRMGLSGYISVQQISGGKAVIIDFQLT